MVYDRVFGGMRELALFAGAGGGILGGRMLGLHTVCGVEIARYPRRVLFQRMEDGLLPRFPIWDDIRTFNGNPWKGHVDIITGGFPCQDISSAGRGLGIEHGKRSGLWREYNRIIREVRPEYVFVENSPMLVSRGLGTVLGDLAKNGYDAAWKVLSARKLGAWHRRDRMWILGKISNTYVARRKQFVHDRQNESSVLEVYDGEEESLCGSLSERVLSDSTVERFQVSAQERNRSSLVEFERLRKFASSQGFGNYWKAEPKLGRVANGVANRVDRLKAIGNGQVPVVAARAMLDLYYELNKGDLTCLR